MPSFSAVCRQIRAVVEARLPVAKEASFQDYAVTVRAEEAGTRIIFDLGQTSPTGGRAKQLLAGEDAADFLSIADRLLPPHVAAITLKNAILESELVLERTTFSRALTLKAICLAIGDCTDLAERQDLKDPCSSARASLSFDGVTFDTPVVLKSVAGCGSFNIIGSKLTGGLLIFGAPFAPADYSFMRGRLLVNKSEITPELFVHRMSFDGIRIALSDIETIQFRDTSIAGTFRLRDSEISSFLSHNNNIRAVDITGNNVENDVTISNLRVRPVTHINLSNNEVAGRLGLGLYADGEPEEGGTGGSDEHRVNVDAWYTEAAGAVDILVDERVSADIDLRGSDFQNELFLSRARADEDGWLTAVRPRQAKPGRTAVHIDLSYASVEILIWNFPTEDEDHTWEGRGFRYTYWDLRPRSGLRPYGEEGVFEGPERMVRWAFKVQAPRPQRIEALTYAADYLRNKGYREWQARVRFRALELALWPGGNVFTVVLLAGTVVLLRPIRTTVSHTLSSVANWLLRWIPRGVMAQVGNIPILVIVVLLAALPTTTPVGNALLYVGLAPVGFGAFPQWALFFMAVTVVGGWLVYSLHSWRFEAEWNRNSVAEAVLDGKRHRIWSQVPGFYQNDGPSEEFSLFFYSLDSTLPFINLHHFERFAPLHVEWLPLVQHGIGWWMSAIFIYAFVSPV